MIDTLFYFSGLHVSHIHKYINLYNNVKKSCSAAMIIDNGRWGVTPDVMNLFRSNDFDNLKDIYLANAQGAMSLISENNFKVGVFGSNYRIPQIQPDLDIKTFKLKKDNVAIQISEMPNEFHYAGADICSVVSPMYEKIYSHKTYGHSNKIFSNCFLHDRVGPVGKLALTKEDFYRKYNLDIDKPFFVWAPDSIQCQHQEAQEVYREVCNIPNIIVKLHPSEHKRHKADRVNGMWSFDLYTDKRPRVLDATDTHFCFEYMEAIISYQSTISREIPIYKKPTIYINVDSDKNLLFRNETKKLHYQDTPYEWVGHSCKLENIRDFVQDCKNYKVDPGEYDKFLSKYLFDKDRHSYDILTDQILELL